MTDFITDAKRILALADRLRRQAPQRPLDLALVDQLFRAAEPTPRTQPAATEQTARRVPHAGRQHHGSGRTATRPG